MGSQSSLLFRLLALGVASGLSATACGKTESDSRAGTEPPVAGSPCDSSAGQYRTGDGCTTCVCDGGVWGCSTLPTLSCRLPCTPGAVKPYDEACICNESGHWTCTDIFPPECEDGEVQQTSCKTCACIGGRWSCTMHCSEAECVPGEQRFDNESWDECRVCTCASPGAWSCEVGDCSCKPNDQIFAADGCNLCTCDESGQWGHCTEGGCGDRCPLPRGGVECDQSPVFAKAYGQLEGSEPCCFYNCPSEVPGGFAFYSSLEECTGCPQDFADCDGDPANGCETDVRTSADHCGQCGNACALQNATAACNASVCTISSCDVDYEDCNGDPSDGCETYIQESMTNCGGCGAVCDLPPNVDGTCFDGSCMSYGCMAGFDDCNGELADGCETNLMTDLGHCGYCGFVCLGPDAHCIEGTCGIE